jgi:hypothetical protein
MPATKMFFRNSVPALGQSVLGLALLGAGHWSASSVGIPHCCGEFPTSAADRGDRLSML